MHCKFLEHGIAISYDQVVKPCCVWKYDSSWAVQNQLGLINLDTWHQSDQIIKIKNQLAQDSWPSSCKSCHSIEKTGRGDSVRLNGARSYAKYSGKDITLEIRPGAVCNFACQTCWPEASTRVAQFQHQAGIIDIKDVNSQSISNFDFLLPFANRIRNVVLLGGEPFYDKNCLKFLDWAVEHLSANITMFTNGSMIRWEWIKNYQHPVTVVFSIDAVGKPAEYIRYGTEWNTVYQNFQEIQKYSHVQLRVNITTSAYNYIYVEDVIDLLLARWPSVVSFGVPSDAYLGTQVVPDQYRAEIVASLSRSIEKTKSAPIEIGQQQNAVNALQSIVDALETSNYDHVLHQKFKKFVEDMDRVKKINIQDYCKFTTDMLAQ